MLKFISCSCSCYQKRVAQRCGRRGGKDENTLLMLENACENDLDKQPPLPSERAWPPECLRARGPGPRSPDLISRWDLEKELVNLPLEQVPLYAVVPVGAPVNSKCI